MRTPLVAALVVALSGCAARPYVEVGAGIIVERTSSAALHPDRAGRNPTAHIAAGVEFERGWLDRCAWEHWSHVRDGEPFNKRPELSKDEVVCFKKWGGRAP